MTIKYTAYSAALTPLTVASLTNNLSTPRGTTINNTADLNTFCDAELVFQFSVAPVARSILSLYRVASVDGTNWSDADPISATFVRGFTVRAVTASQRVVRERIPLLPGMQAFFLQNTETGQTLTSATMRIYTYNLDQV